MTREETVDQFFDSVNESYDALLDAVKSANDRGYRISRKLIDDVEQAQRDTFDQSRTLGLARQLLDEVSDSGREARDTARKLIEANRGAGQAAIEATRSTVKRAAPVVEQAVNGVRARTTRKAAGTTKKSS